MKAAETGWNAQTARDQTARDEEGCVLEGAEGALGAREEESSELCFVCGHVKRLDRSCECRVDASIRHHSRMDGSIV